MAARFDGPPGDAAKRHLLEQYVKGWGIALADLDRRRRLTLAVPAARSAAGRVHIAASDRDAVPAPPGAVLRYVARLLPGAFRQRFIAESMGDLGACESRRERIVRLASVVIAVPALAWMMWRESRRRRV